MTPPRSTALLVLTRLGRNLERIRDRIRDAQARGAHAAPTVRLVVVTKSAPPEILGLLPGVGVRDVGENRVQAAQARRPGAPAGLVWHGIGHLQRNKAQAATEVFDEFHALDSLRLAARLESVLADADRRWPVYTQVNAASDPAKGGLPPEETLAFLKDLADLPHLVCRGFMTMGRLDADEAETRAAFRMLREVRDEAVRRGRGAVPPVELSMGMTQDYEWAVEEGASVVRIGTAVFEGVLDEAGTLRTDAGEERA